MFGITQDVILTTYSNPTSIDGTFWDFSVRSIDVLMAFFSDFHIEPYDCAVDLLMPSTRWPSHCLAARLRERQI